MHSLTLHSSLLTLTRFQEQSIWCSSIQILDHWWEFWVVDTTCITLLYLLLETAKTQRTMSEMSFWVIYLCFCPTQCAECLDTLDFLEVTSLMYSIGMKSLPTVSWCSTVRTYLPSLSDSVSSVRFLQPCVWCSHARETKSSSSFMETNSKDPSRQLSLPTQLFLLHHSCLLSSIQK